MVYMGWKSWLADIGGRSKVRGDVRALAVTRRRKRVPKKQPPDFGGQTGVVGQIFAGPN